MPIFSQTAEKQLQKLFHNMRIHIENLSIMKRVMKDNTVIVCYYTAPSAEICQLLRVSRSTELSKDWTLEKEFNAELLVEDQKLAENHRTASSEHDATRNNKSANKHAHQLAAQEVVVMLFFHQQKRTL